MLSLHIFADYHLQGVLANLKRKDNWSHNFPGDLFDNKYSYMAALAAHSFEWSVIVMLPCLLSIYHTCTDYSQSNVRTGVIYILFLVLNTMFHYVVDDLKANDKKIGLVEDQCFHVAQILCTWLLWTQSIGW